MFVTTLLWIANAKAENAEEPRNYKVQLIWGTDEAKPKNNDKVKDLDPKLLGKLKKLKIFSWKNYFEVDCQTVGVKEKGSAITSMSHKCVIEIKHIQDQMIEIKLYGEGKLVQTVRQNLPHDEFLIIAGDAKEKYNDAWLVAVSLKTKEAEKKETDKK
jgi:hypothetical protein